MRCIALDVGTVRVGVAVFEAEIGQSQPRHYLVGKDLKALVGLTLAQIDSISAEVLVLGLPRHLDGREGPSARRVRKFAQLLAEKQPELRIELFEEWLTTTEARRGLAAQGLKEPEIRERVDSAAACIILDAWLACERHLAGR